MKKYNSWDEIDKDTGGLVTLLTYIVLFVNDQVDNFEMLLSDHIKGCGLYRQKVKMTESTAWTAKWRIQQTNMPDRRCKRGSHGPHYAEHGGRYQASYRSLWIYRQPGIA